MIELVCLNEELLKNVMIGIEKSMFQTEIEFLLLVDNNPVIRYNAILQKYNGVAEGICTAEVQYCNLFYETENKEELDKYVGKGYAKVGLNMVTEFLLNYNIPYIHLDISENNIASQKVAEACNYIKDGETYLKFHENAKELFENSLGEKLNQSHDIIMQNFINYQKKFGIEQIDRKR